MLKKRLLIVFLLIISFLYCYGSDLLTLYGKPEQGSFLLGKVNADVEMVFWNYEQLTLNDSTFILAFDRDDSLRHKITIALHNGELHEFTLKLDAREYNIQRIERMQKKYVQQPANPELTKRINREAAMMKEARSTIYNNSFRYFDKFIRPIAGGRISGVFGSQRVINGVPKRPHNGLDIAVPQGTPIKAMSSGIVAITGDFFYNGKFVLLDHGLGLSSVYLHMSKIDVQKGDFLQAGAKIGEVGSTGRSTGNHLHWGVNWFKKRIDPEAFLRLDETYYKLKHSQE